MRFSKKLNFKVETLYEDDDTQEKSESSEQEISLLQVKGIGKGTVENLKNQGITSISDLLAVDPEELSARISGASVKTIGEWQKNAKTLVNT